MLHIFLLQNEFISIGRNTLKCFTKFGDDLEFILVKKGENHKLLFAS